MMMALLGYKTRLVLDSQLVGGWRRGVHRLMGLRGAGLVEGQRTLPQEGVTAGPKSLKEMPGPSTFRNLVEFFGKDGFSRIHEIQQKHINEYGRIFKSHFGPQFVVSIADRDMIAQVLRAEREAPQRANMESWQEYRDLRGRSTGLISAEGKKWLTMRSVLRQKILRPRDVFVYAGGVNEVVGDLIKRIQNLRSHEEDGETVTNVNDLYFKYSMEAVATILYECRLGCLENVVPKQTVEYIEALELMFRMFKMTMYAGAIPKWLRTFIPKPWEEFCRSWDGLFTFSQIHVDHKLQEIQARLDRGEEVQGGLLTMILISKELTLEELYANMTEMLLAGVDTTSFTLSWATYLLAKNPQVQQMVYNQIVQNLGKDTIPTAEDVPKLPLIRAVLKETLRLFPVLPGNGRVTQDDLVLGGYFIPKGTQLALCHYSTSYDEDYFSAAEDFRPQRWLRHGHLDRVDNFGSIPFGYGLRSYVSPVNMSLHMHMTSLHTRLIQKFELKTSPKTLTVLPKTHGLLCPSGAINVRYADRE
ncbi:PREDICTED: cytochrome P450 27C1 [Nanorana parkeri]|uniref:cytochrome P450 27C1 n=1 Tax=Nanorana parkeri TaxID=125878 RepID=UPI0008542336|nr:PREDICTED: cytochrome P450 27C1 [Nanorana parkeri]